MDRYYFCYDSPGGTQTSSEMEARKRQREDDGESPKAEKVDQKRARSSETSEAAEALLLFETAASCTTPSTNSCNNLSVEEMICVPLNLLFRQAAPPNGLSQQRSSSQTQQSQFNDVMSASTRPLLSRAEAQCFLRVRLLAQKLDSLVAASSQALEHRFQCRQWTQCLQTVHDRRALSPCFLPLFTLLHTIGEYGPSQTLQSIEKELEDVIRDLSKSAMFLRQFGEQNWAVFESFQDSLGPAVYVATEKRRLSDLQEECCNRIEALLQKKSLPTTTMDEYCRTLWSSTGTENGNSSQHLHHDAAATPKSASCSSQSQSQSSRKPEAASPEEKENSQQQRLKELIKAAASPAATGSFTASRDAGSSSQTSVQLLASMSAASNTNSMSSWLRRDG